MPDEIASVADAERLVWQAVGARLADDGSVEPMPYEEWSSLAAR